MDLHRPLRDKILRRRDWRWLRVRIHGLLNRPGTRLHDALSADQPLPVPAPPLDPDTA